LINRSFIWHKILARLPFYNQERMRRISSRQNALVARFRELARGRGPDGAVLLDGEHLVEEAIDAGVVLETVAFAERVIDSRADGLVARLERTNVDLVRAPDQVLAAMSPARQPSGIVAIARVQPSSVDDVLREQPALVLVLAGIQDAGNVGAIIRAADGCGATGVIATDGTADPFGWKALRGAMGSSFRMPTAVKQPLAPTIARLKATGIAVLATVPRDGRTPADSTLTRPAAIVLGAEGAGLSDDLVASADERLTVPMRPPVESLNVAITAAVILYEASQQRRR
jgi:RNA methyltransferase, TrmH family